MINYIKRISLLLISNKNNSNKNNINRDIINKVSVKNIDYSVEELDKLFSSIKITPTTSTSAVMFNAGQRSVIDFLLGKEGKSNEHRG